MNNIKKRAFNSSSESSANKRRRAAHIQKPASSNPKDSKGLSQCFHKFSTSLYLSIAPLYSSNPIEGIKAQHLDTMIMKHFAPAGGVVIGYTNLKISEEFLSIEDNEIITAKLNPHQPFAFLWCDVDLLVWKPQVGDVVEGSIYIQSPTHIGLLINDTFNAVIKKANIPSNWEFIPNQVDEEDGEEAEQAAEAEEEVKEKKNDKNSQSLGSWADSNGSLIQGKIQFNIKNIRSNGLVVSVDGSLLVPGTEIQDLPVQPTQPLNKKIKFDDLDTTVETEDVPSYKNDDSGSSSSSGDSSDDSDEDGDSSDEEEEDEDDTD